MNVKVLDKINSKIEEYLKDPSTVEKAVNMILVLESCYSEEFNSVTKDIQKILTSKSKQYTSLLHDMKSLDLGQGKVMIDGQETSILSLDRLNKIFEKDSYSAIKTAFCLIPENLILLSLEKEITNEIVK